MTRFAPSFARGLTAALLLAGLAQTLACKSVTMVSPDAPIQVQAKPPAPPLADLAPVPQPPPPPRVTLEGDILKLDEALSFDDADQLAPDHADILAELAKWLAVHPEALLLSVEAHSIGEGSKRAHKQRSAAMAKQIVDALVAEGIEAGRLLALGLGKSADAQRHITLRLTQRAEESQP